MIHRVFDSARLNASVINDSGLSVAAAEWFVVPLKVIDEAIELIISGDIVHYVDNPSVGKLVKNPSA